MWVLQQKKTENARGEEEEEGNLNRSNNMLSTWYEIHISNPSVCMGSVMGWFVSHSQVSDTESGLARAAARRL